MRMIPKSIENLLADVGMSWKTCPKCGVSGEHFSFVILPKDAPKKRIKEYVKIENADSFQCLACHEAWGVKP